VSEPSAVLRPGLLPEPLIFERGACGRTGALVDPAAAGGPASTDVLPPALRREDDLARAAQLKSEAEAASASYQKTLAEARAQAQATIKETADRLAADAAARQRALAATLAEQIAAAERRIAATKDEALAEVRGIAVDVGRAVVEKLTGVMPDMARMTAAVDGSLGGQRH